MMKICNLEDWVKVLLIAKESLMSMIVKHALDLIYSYLLQNYRRDSLIKIEHELLEITRDSKIVFDVNKLDIKVTYESLQEKLSKLNEKETVRKTMECIIHRKMLLILFLPIQLNRHMVSCLRIMLERKI